MEFPRSKVVISAGPIGDWCQETEFPGNTVVTFEWLWPGSTGWPKWGGEAEVRTGGRCCR